MIDITIGGIEVLTLNDADGIAASIFFQGCPFRCKGCHNPELQTFEGGIKTTTSKVMREIIKHIDWYDSVAIMGGEPLAQERALTDLLRRIRLVNLKVWLYTGYRIEEVLSEIKALCDVIVAGPYVEELKTRGFPASSNQVVWRKAVSY